MKINLNDKIRFKPTERGLEILKSKGMEKVLHDGYYNCQMWEFMSVFGDEMCVGDFNPMIEENTLECHGSGSGRTGVMNKVMGEFLSYKKRNNQKKPEILILDRVSYDELFDYNSELFWGRETKPEDRTQEDSLHFGVPIAILTSNKKTIRFI